MIINENLSLTDSSRYWVSGLVVAIHADGTQEFVESYSSFFDTLTEAKSWLQSWRRFYVSAGWDFHDSLNGFGSLRNLTAEAVKTQTARHIGAYHTGNARKSDLRVSFKVKYIGQAKA